MVAIGGVNQERFIHLRLRQSVRAGRFMPLVMDKNRNNGQNERYRQMNIMKWVKERVSEPSSYAAVGVAVMGVGMILDIHILIYVGIAGGVLGFFLKERGVI